MSAGALDRRIAIRRAALTNTGLGTVTTWSEIATLWASRKDASDGEKAVAGTVQSTVVSRFVVRSSVMSRGIRPTDRLTEGGLTYEITGIKEVGRRDRLEITAEARLDHEDNNQDQGL
ncbi:head-tail adaptor protein [Falsigemmobacter faecalis]|uniref:Head-tail adaptor protein n=1 Tax=Falsigemmobacter faecalis TaxID=2488730 RepID=A0A3P3DHE7_9RHOB|nr:head-tail adaptor protein [Falsigemmobacter faecalis]RRH71998.1 head-tail adaptor protein [Falsigemmobacter faecalis]